MVPNINIKQKHRSVASPHGEMLIFRLLSAFTWCLETVNIKWAPAAIIISC